MVDVMWFDQCLEVVLKHFREVILQLGAAEVFENFLPVRGILNNVVWAKFMIPIRSFCGKTEGSLTDIVATEIRFKLAGKDLECSTLSDTVGSNESENLPWSRCRQPVELERIGRVSVRDLGFKICGQVDDGDSLEWASRQRKRNFQIRIINQK